MSTPTTESLGAPFTKSCDEVFLRELGRVESKTVLDVGSGLGELSLVVSQMGGNVIGLDVSKMMVARSSERSRHTGISAEFLLGDAQDIPFRDSSLDLVVGMRAVHHFPDLRLFFKEVYRVLKPGGRAVFIEPQKKNPIVEFNRKVLNPEMRTEGEHPLVVSDIEAAAIVFDDVTIRTFYLVSPLSYVFQFLLRWDSAYEISYEILQKLDSALQSRRILQPYCWQVIIALDKQ